MKGTMVFALVSGIVIFGVSTTVAYVFFSILESSAEASLQNWKLGGAFAGFVFTASLLTSITFQFYKQITADQISDYRDQIQELQAKLVRGAPCPEKYTIEVDEKSKLVFARPTDWSHRGGILYDYGELAECGESGGTSHFKITAYSLSSIVDLHKARNLLPIDVNNVNVANLYDDCAKEIIKNVPQEAIESVRKSMSKEFTLVDGIRSLRVNYHYMYGPEKEERRIRRCDIFTYVPRLETLFTFRVGFVEENYQRSSEEFNNIIRSVRFLT